MEVTDKPHPIDTPERLAHFIGDQLSEDLEAWELSDISKDNRHSPSESVCLLDITKDGSSFRCLIWRKENQ